MDPQNEAHPPYGAIRFVTPTHVCLLPQYERIDATVHRVSLAGNTRGRADGSPCAPGTFGRSNLAPRLPRCSCRGRKTAWRLLGRTMDNAHRRTGRDRSHLAQSYGPPGEWLDETQCETGRCVVYSLGQLRGILVCLGLLTSTRLACMVAEFARIRAIRGSVGGPPEVLATSATSETCVSLHWDAKQIP